jgi:hypothetical protein
MKIIKEITIQPLLGNTVINEVIAWCKTTFGDGDFRTWRITSNYTRELEAEFDVVFTDEKHAMLFVLRWGGVYSKVVTEEVPGIDNETFNRLFEVV